MQRKKKITLSMFRQMLTSKYGEDMKLHASKIVFSLRDELVYISHRVRDQFPRSR